MKIIHTADWHLCDRLRRVDRSADLRARVEIIAGLCEEHDVDLLVIAGDVFSEQASVEQMTGALTHLRETFAPFFARGGTILAVTGNHDREVRIEMLRAGMALAAPPIGGRVYQPGRAYLLNRPHFGTLEGRAGERVQFVLVPYPTSSRYAEPDDTFRSKDEENRALAARVTDWLRSVPEHKDFDPTLPTVLVGHLHVRGANPYQLFQITERDDVILEAGNVPTSWAYVALGHVHKPQALGGMAHVRYCGSLDRLDFGELGDDKGVVLLDIGPTGLRQGPTWLPIAATPMLNVEFTDPTSDLNGLADRYPNSQSALVRARVTQGASGPSRDEIVRELRRVFPRYTEISWQRPSSPNHLYGPQPDAQADYRSTIREYLASQLEGDPDRAALLELAEAFLREDAP